MNIPMREKYVDEAVGIWFIFGEHPGGSLVDISDGTNDVFRSLPRAPAVKLCEVQERFRQELYSILCEPKA